MNFIKIQLEYICINDILTNEWNVLAHKLPKPLNSFGCTLIFNGQCVLLLGGWDGIMGAYCDDVCIDSISKGIFNKLTIKCPGKSPYQAFTIKDRRKDELLTFGWMKNEWRISAIDDHLFPPQYLIRIIYKYYVNEFIHLFGDLGGHWKIDVFDLIV